MLLIAEETPRRWHRMNGNGMGANGTLLHNGWICMNKKSTIEEGKIETPEKRKEARGMKRPQFEPEPD
jgi:hypothetical protein